MLWALLVVAAGSLGVLVWLRRLAPDSAAGPVVKARINNEPERRTHGAGGSVRAPGLKSTANPFAAISVKPGNNACAAVNDTTNVRYLEDFAPLLPVPGCDRLACSCTFQRYTDRRTNEQGERRSREFSPTSEGGTTGSLMDRSVMDRRQLHGRRITDHS